MESEGEEEPTKIKTNKKTKIRASTLDFLVMYCDRMVKTVYIDQAESTLFPGKYNI